MRPFTTGTAALLAALMAFASCEQNPEYPTPDVPPGDDPVVTGPTSAQLSAVSDFVTIAIATDDYCAALETNDSLFVVRTFKGDSISIPAHIEIVPEGGSVSGLVNYVIDGSRYAEFHLGGETQSFPSDIHQWYNPSIIKGSGALSILAIGGEFSADAVRMLPDMISAAKAESITVGSLYKEGATLSDILQGTDFVYSEAADGASKWGDSTSVTVAGALLNRPWDVVTLMENPMSEAGWTCDSTAKATIASLLDLIFSTCRTRRPSVIMALGPTLPSEHQIVTDNFGGSQGAMFDAIAAYGREVVKSTGIFDVVSVCAAIQSLRGSEVGVASTNGLTCDGTRLDRCAGCFTAAGTMFQKIIERSTDLKFFSNTYVPSASSTVPGEIGVGVTNAFLPICRNAAKFAVESPFDTVDLSALRTKIPSDGLPDAGYIDSGIEFKDETPDEDEGDGGGTPGGETKLLVFDFATFQQGLLPASALEPQSMNHRWSFKLLDNNSKEYFKFYNAGGAYHGASNAYTTIYDGKKTGYLGLPAVEGYKLTKIACNRGVATGASVSLEVLSDIAAGTNYSGTVSWTAGKALTDTIFLSGTKENTVYYIHSLNGSYVPISTLTLEYTQANGAASAREKDYDIFLFIGQSNMAGRGAVEASDCAPMDSVYLFTDGDNTVVYAAQPLLNIESTVRKSASMQKFNLAGPFARTVSRATGRKVLIVLNARGETTMENWMKGADPFDFNASDDAEKQGTQCPGLYSEAVRRAKAAMKYGTLRGIIWHQGEGNANIGQVPYYMPKLKTFVENLRQDLGMTAAQLPFIAGELNRSYVWAGNLNPYLNTIADEIPNSACASSLDCGVNEDNVHFSTAGLTLIGQRYAQCYLDLVK